MIRVFCLDLATQTGFAVGDVGGTPRWGSVRLGVVEAAASERLVFLDRWLSDMLAVEQPDIVVYEEPVIARGHQTIRQLIQLSGIVELVAKKSNVIHPVYSIAPSAIKKDFFGHGGATKPQIIAECLRRGWKTYDDNAADALALWDVVCRSPLMADLIQQRQRRSS